MRIMVAIPCMDTVHTRFMQSFISMRKPCEVEVSFSISSLVYDARNALSMRGIQNNYDYVLWLDSDMVFGPDFLERLLADMSDERHFVSAIYSTRKAPIGPCVYSKIDVGQAEMVKEVPKEMFEIAACGFGGVLMSVPMLIDVFKHYGRPFSPILGYGEDFSFCHRASELGYKLFCDPSIRMGHEGTFIYEVPNNE